MPRPWISAAPIPSTLCSSGSGKTTARLDLLVNSAGGQFPQAAIDFSEKGWKAVIDTNLNGTWFMMQAAARRWRDTETPGSIVNIVVVTRHGLFGVAHTVAARAGVVGLSQNLAVEMGAAGYPRQLHRTPAPSKRRAGMSYTPRGARPVITVPIR